MRMVSESFVALAMKTRSWEVSAAAPINFGQCSGAVRMRRALLRTFIMAAWSNAAIWPATISQPKTPISSKQTSLPHSAASFAHLSLAPFAAESPKCRLPRGAPRLNAVAVAAALDQPSGFECIEPFPYSSVGAAEFAGMLAQRVRGDGG
jgi:hypothetical protein